MLRASSSVFAISRVPTPLSRISKIICLVFSSITISSCLVRRRVQERVQCGGLIPKRSPDRVDATRKHWIQTTQCDFADSRQEDAQAPFHPGELLDQILLARIQFARHHAGVIDHLLGSQNTQWVFENLATHLIGSAPIVAMNSLDVSRRELFLVDHLRQAAGVIRIGARHHAEHLQRGVHRDPAGDDPTLNLRW